jgi:hypothetical protein
MNIYLVTFDPMNRGSEGNLDDGKEQVFITASDLGKVQMAIYNGWPRGVILECKCLGPAI